MKKIISFLMAAISILGLSSCGQQNQSPVTSSSPTTNNNITQSQNSSQKPNATTRAS